MIAIFTSALIGLYFLIPQALFTFILGKFVPLRTFIRTRVEELNEILLLLFLTFFIVYGLVWYCPGLRSFPFGFNDNSTLRRQDYKILVDNIVGRTTKASDDDLFWAAFGRSARRQGRLLSWFYAAIVGEGFLFGYLSKNYGRFQNSRKYRWFADMFLLPNISEWHPLLTGFTLKDSRKPIIADVLSGDTLYKGELARHFIDKDGKLSGLILTDPWRFDRLSYLTQKQAGNNPKPDDYWRAIPSAKLYLFANSISNLNLNYDASEADEEILRGFVSKILRKDLPPNMKITVGVLQRPASSESANGGKIDS